MKNRSRRGLGIWSALAVLLMVPAEVWASGGTPLPFNSALELFSGNIIGPTAKALVIICGVGALISYGMSPNDAFFRKIGPWFLTVAGIASIPMVIETLGVSGAVSTSDASAALFFGATVVLFGLLPVAGVVLRRSIRDGEEV